MEFYHQIMIVGLGFVVVEALLILLVNTMRGFCELVNLTHMVSVVFWCIYLTVVLYASETSHRSNEQCDKVWKITATTYISLNMAVYSFYYARSKVWGIIKWEGRAQLERLAFVMIPSMAVAGLGFFFIPIRGVQYNALLVEGECQPVRRQWMAIVWLLGDTALSALLLLLFIQPLKEIQRLLGDTKKSLAMLLHLRRIIRKNRNLLGITVLATAMVYITIVVVELKMRTIHYLCVIDRLITIQCITLSFSYDSQDYFYFYACFSLSCNNPQQFEFNEMSTTWHSKSTPSLINMSPKLQSASTVRDELSKGRIISGAVV